MHGPFSKIMGAGPSAPWIDAPGRDKTKKKSHATDL